MTGVFSGVFSGVSFDFSGAHVLVAGGSSGIGLATARAFAAAGAQVAITGTRAQAGDYGEDFAAFRYLPMDIEDGASIDAAVATLDQLDIVVNSAGIALPSLGLDEYEPEIFARAVNMMLTGPFRLFRAAESRLSASRIAGGASAISIASMTSYFGTPIVPGYGAAKTGILGLTRALAASWGPRGIRVNAVAAGLTLSRMTAGTFANEAWTSPTLARTPLGRLGAPEDIAGAILFLASPAASWITGQTLPVDGGYTISG